MVIPAFRSKLPLINSPPAAFGFDAELGGQVVGNQSVLFGPVAEKREASAVSHRDGESSVDKGFPEVGVKHDVPNRPLPMDIRNTPVVTDALTRPAFVFRKRLARRADKAAVAGHYDRCVRGLATELIDDIS